MDTLNRQASFHGIPAEEALRVSRSDYAKTHAARHGFFVQRRLFHDLMVFPVNGLEPVDDGQMLGAGRFARAALNALGSIEAAFDLATVVVDEAALLLEHLALVVAVEDVGDMHVLGAGLAVLAAGALDGHPGQVRLFQLLGEGAVLPTVSLSKMRRLSSSCSGVLMPLRMVATSG